MKIVKILISTSLIVSSLMALEPMQKEAGWSGFVLMGGGGISYESSEISGLKILDLDHKTIQDRSSAKTESGFLPMLTGTVQYTLEDKKTEFFAGNSLEDFLRFDMSLALGARHQFDGVGILGVRFLFSTTPTQVWEDPLLTGVERTSTDRTSKGLGLKWESIMGSNFEVDVRARKFEFDTDRNGISLIDNANAGTSAGTNGEVYITSAQQKLLEREGNMVSIEGLYTWHVNQSHFLIPSIKLTDDNRDGDARDNTRIDLKLSYVFINQHWTVASLVSLGKASYDTENPIFQKKQDTNLMNLGINATYKQVFDWKHWSLNANVFMAKGDSDIDFYDQSLYVATVGVVYSF